MYLNFSECPISRHRPVLRVIFISQDYPFNHGAYKAVYHYSPVYKEFILFLFPCPNRSSCPHIENIYFYPYIFCKSQIFPLPILCRPFELVYRIPFPFLYFNSYINMASVKGKLSVLIEAFLYNTY